MRIIHWSAILIILPPLTALAQQNPPPADYTYHQFILDNLTAMQARLIGPYKANGPRNPAWDTDALSFMQKTTRFLVYSDKALAMWPDDLSSQTRVELVGMGDDLVRRGCDEPDVTYCYAVVLSQAGRDAEAVTQLRHTLSVIKDGNYPPESVMAAAARLRKFTTLLLPGEMDSLNRDIEASAVKRFSVRRTMKMDRYFTRDILKSDVAPDLEMDARVCAKAQRLADGDPWLVDIISGEYEILAAWDARGRGWGSEVTDAQAKAMRDHLARARTFLTAAWKIDPTIPGPADDMITVVMGEDESQGETMRLWYDRAMAAMTDDGTAFQNLLYGLYPRWHGSYDDMLALGLEEAGTCRFDTQAPMWLMYTVQAIQADSGGNSDYDFASPRIYNATSAMLEGYENANSPGRARNFYRSARDAELARRPL